MSVSRQIHVPAVLSCSTDPPPLTLASACPNAFKSTPTVCATQTDSDAQTTSY